MTATSTAPAAPPLAAARRAALPSTLRLGLARTRVELRGFFRERDAVIFIFAYPIIMLAIFATVFDGEVQSDGSAAIDFAQYFLPGMIATGVLLSSFQNVAVAIAVERDEGGLKRLRGTPLPATAPPGGRRRPGPARSPDLLRVPGLAPVVPGLPPGRHRHLHTRAGAVAAGDGEGPAARRHTVAHAAQADEEACALAPALAPDVVLMDLRMPGLDGPAATERILADLPGTRVVVLTTYETDADILRAVEAGATGYLLKDTPRDDLVAAVRAVADGETVLAPSVARRLVRGVRTSGERLTPRELDVLRGVARGWTNAQIGAELFISEATVKTHLLRIFTKLGVDDRTRAVTVALERGILRAP